MRAQNEGNAEKRAPQSIEAEQNVLGGLLLDPTAWPTVAGVLESGDFSAPEHVFVYGAMVDLAEAGKPCDLQAVYQQLFEQGAVEDGGGLSGLRKLCEGTLASAANIETYARVVLEKSRQRQLLKIAQAIQNDAGQSTAEDVVKFVQAQLDEVKRTSANSDDGWPEPKAYSYGADFDPAAIPLREFILGNRRSRAEVTVDVGPPGVNKSTLQLIDAVQIATGRQILADAVHVPGGAGVLFLVGEDARRDFEARLAAILERHHIKPAELGGKLHVIYLSEIESRDYTLAHMVGDLAVLNTRMLEWLRDRPDVVAIFIDPLAAWHHLMENSNDALTILTNGFKSLAVKGNRHVGFNHHVNKASMNDPEAHVHNLAALRGAGVIGASVRWAFTLAKLRADTAQQFGIPEAEIRRYRRLDPLKASYAEDDGPLRLLKVESVRIANGETVGCLVEVDTHRAQSEAAERRTNDEEEWAYEFTVALTRMLEQNGACSQRGAATWLIANYPKLFSNKDGRALSLNSVRDRLPNLIGAGLPVTVAGRERRIVIREGGRRNALEVVFEDDNSTGQGTGQ